MGMNKAYPSTWLDAVKTLLQHRGRVLPDEWERAQIVRDATAQALEKDIDPTDILFEKAMAELEREHPHWAQILRLRYWDGETLAAIGHRVNRSQASVHRDLQAAMERLAHILWRWECRAEDAFRRAQYARLEPSTYDQLFGVESSLAALERNVLAADGPTIMVLTGMGGIGKTSLADALCRKLIVKRAFAAFGWVSLRPQISLWDERSFFRPISESQALEQIFERLAQQLLGPEGVSAPFSLENLLARLAHRLHRMPHFIVIDNLEILDGIAALMAELKRLAGPTRFLITSRVGHFEDPDAYHMKASPLDREAAIALLRHEGRRRNIRVLLEVGDDLLSTVYDKVGGNPLALRLVAGQLHTHSLSTVLDDLAQARGRSVTRLFAYIYRRAWENLEETEQSVLLAMPLLPPEGGAAEQLIAITGLSDEQVHDALETLVQQNLVDHYPAPVQSRYAVHHLTRTFLQEQAARWS